MSFAINIRAAVSGASQIIELWDIAGQFETYPSMRQLGYPPHFTFGIFSDIEPSLLQDVAEELAARYDKTTLSFSQIDYFDVTPLVLWLRADNESILYEMHSHVHTCVPSHRCLEHYKLNQWQPHCTLAYQITEENRKAALKFADQRIEPFEVMFDTIDWVEYPPVEILGEISL